MTIDADWVIAESKRVFQKEALRGAQQDPSKITREVLEEAAAIVGVQMYTLGHNRGYDLGKGVIARIPPRPEPARCQQCGAPVEYWPGMTVCSRNAEHRIM